MYLAPTPVTVPERFAWSVGALIYAIGTRMRVGEMAVLGLAICRRIGKIRNEVLDLIKRIEAGTLREVRGRKPAATRREMDEATRRLLAERLRVAARMPRKAGWLLGLVPYEAAGYAAQLSLLLQEEEMRRHLAATPRLARKLRPLCRMLGMDLALLGETPTDPKPRKRKQVAETPTGEKAKPARRHKEGAEPREPSRAEIKRIIATRRWPSIEMQADPKRYPWYPYPEDETGPPKGGETD